MDKNEAKRIFANKGVERNKTPLSNIVLMFKVAMPKEEWLTEFSEKYKPEDFQFKDFGYIILLTRSEKSSLESYYQHGFISPTKVKEMLSVKQWSKFCQGERTFVIQRRVDGKNIKKKQYKK